MKESRKYCHINKSWVMLFALCQLCLITACSKDDAPKKTNNVIAYTPVSVTKSNSTQVYAHYMPWFEDKSSSSNGQWGQHWTMATQNPDIVDSNGRRQIASYFYPLIGPYASSDPDVIEYHLLLMKYSGIDGVLIDWYGSHDVNDYGNIRKNAEALIEMLAKVGLKFAIVYEDRTIPNVINSGQETDAIETAQADLTYAETNYFNTDEYIRIQNKPLLLVFGPEYLQKASQWTDVFSTFSEKPCFLTLNGTSNETAPNSSGEYIWVDANSLDSKYKTKDKFDVFFGGAYPGFKDFYAAGGWGSGYNLPYPHNNGTLFQENLDKAKATNVNYLQLITWNDFGEGTMIEPTREFGFSLLEKVQNFAGISYTATDLQYIYKLYSLRKSMSGNSSAQKSLTQAFYYFVSLRQQQAENILDSLSNNK